MPVRPLPDKDPIMSSSRAIVCSLAACWLALSLLAACGKRGPLYLPGDEAGQDAPAQQEAEKESSPDASGY